MKKIISLFQRDYEGTRLVIPTLVPGAEWVVEGQGTATIKYDGTCCAIIANVLYKRYDAKKGKTPPTLFLAAQDPDPITGHWPGWLPVDEKAPEDRWHREGYDNARDVVDPTGDWRLEADLLRDWTYELVGPKVQGNPYGLTAHTLRRHGEGVLEGIVPDFEWLRGFFADNAVEGIVWWKDLDDVDSDKVKIKRKDFGLPWPVPPSDNPLLQTR